MTKKKDGHDPEHFKERLEQARKEAREGLPKVEDDTDKVLAERGLERGATVPQGSGTDGDTVVRTTGVEPAPSVTPTSSTTVRRTKGGR
jgi:hypothetical protein